MIKLSFVIVTYNSPELINSCIDFITKHTRATSYEIVIVDNGSERQWFSDFYKNQTNTKLLRIEKNGPYGAAVNLGAMEARGKYLAFIDADDIWKKNKIRDQIKFMKHNKLKISHTSYSIINEKGQKISKRDIKYKLSYKDLINSCDIGLSTVIISKRLFLQHKFSANKTKEDYSLWLRISKKINIYGLKKELMLWRKTSNSLSSNILQKFYDAFDIYFNQEKFNFTTSVYRVLILSLNFLKKNNKQN